MVVADPEDEVPGCTLGFIAMLVLVPVILITLPFCTWYNRRAKKRLSSDADGGVAPARSKQEGG